MMAEGHPSHRAKGDVTMKLLWVALAAVLMAGCAVVPAPYPYAAPGVSVGVGVGVPVYRGGFHRHRPYRHGHHGHYGRPYYRHR
jgi:hypothetical protein